MYVCGGLLVREGIMPTYDPKSTKRISVACCDEAEDHLPVKKVVEAKISAGSRVLRRILLAD